MSEQPNNEICVTFKGNGAFDSPWIVIRGATPEEVYGVMDKLSQDDAFMTTTAQLGVAFREIWIESGGGNPPANSGGGGQQSRPASNGAPQLGDDHPTEKCDKCSGNPALTFQHWETKGGKVYDAYRCPTGTFGHGFKPGPR